MHVDQFDCGASVKVGWACDYIDLRVVLVAPGESHPGYVFVGDGDPLTGFESSAESRAAGASRYRVDRKAIELFIKDVILHCDLPARGLFVAAA